MLLVGPLGHWPKWNHLQSFKEYNFPKKHKNSSLLRKPNCGKKSFGNFCMKSQIEWPMGNSSCISPCDMKVQKNK
jgi:hypothetical protein